MAGISLECVLMIAYAFMLGLIALMLDWAAGNAHRRSLGVSTSGFTYHPAHDRWSCPRVHHLFPVFSDSARGTVIYRAPASACNSCPSKAACTDSTRGREIEMTNLTEYGMKKFRRGVSLTLLVLASLILAVELCRAGGLYPRIILGIMLLLFGSVSLRRAEELMATQTTRSEN